MNATQVRMLRKPEVLKARGRGHAAHYNDIASGLMTTGVRISSQSVAWPDSRSTRSIAHASPASRMTR